MKLALIYNPLDNKLREDTYSFIYRGMFDAVVAHFQPQHITSNCHRQEIDADVILFWDVNSCHHITIEGLPSHPALKFEYMSDPFQQEVKGVYLTYNMFVHKLGPEQRIRRALDRGVSKIVCPVRDGFNRYYSPVFGSDLIERLLLHFPPSPWFASNPVPLSQRLPEILANGSTGEAQGAYVFRSWAYEQTNLTRVPHWISNRSTPAGKAYGGFLGKWAGALALCDLYPVVKYFEIPLAGCVTFMQYHSELEDLGFRDEVSCIYVNMENFHSRIRDFLHDPGAYQSIADAGLKIMQENYTAKHFALFLEDSFKKLLQ